MPRDLSSNDSSAKVLVEPRYRAVSACCFLRCGHPRVLHQSISGERRAEASELASARPISRKRHCLNHIRKMGAYCVDARNSAFPSMLYYGQTKYRKEPVFMRAAQEGERDRDVFLRKLFLIGFCEKYKGRCVVRVHFLPTGKC
jgi:hypothetical protein